MLGVLQAFQKRKKREKEVITTQGIRIWSPIQVLTPPNSQCLTLLSRRDVVLCLWYSASKLNALFLYLIGEKVTGRKKNL